MWKKSKITFESIIYWPTWLSTDNSVQVCIFEGYDVGHMLISPTSCNSKGNKPWPFVVWQIHTIVFQINIHAICGIYLTAWAKVSFIHLLIWVNRTYCTQYITQRNLNKEALKWLATWMIFRKDIIGRELIERDRLWREHLQRHLTFKLYTWDAQIDQIAIQIFQYLLSFGMFHRLSMGPLKHF